MPPHVCDAAVVACTCGAIPGNLTILPVNRKTTTGQPSATINDFIPLVNIPSFGICDSLANPAVIAESGAPAPFVPGTFMPWAPGSPNVTLAGIPTSEIGDTTLCLFGGEVTVLVNAQFTQTVP